LREKAYSLKNSRFQVFSKVLYISEIAVASDPDTTATPG